MSASPTLTPTEDITSPAEGSQRVHSMDFGAEVLPSGHVRFRLWGPGASTISIELDGHSQPLPMTPQLDGWHELVTDQAAAGTCYQFVLPDGLHVPDPASRFQPEDVHGPSEVIDPTAYICRTVTGRVVPGRTPSSTSSTSAPSPPKAPSPPPSASSITWSSSASRPSRSCR